MTLIDDNPNEVQQASIEQEQQQIDKYYYLKIEDQFIHFRANKYMLLVLSSLLLSNKI